MSPRTLTLAVWAALAAAAVGIEIAGLASGGRRPTIAGLVRAIVSHPVARVVLLVGWMWLGWHAFAR